MVKRPPPTQIKRGIGNLACALSVDIVNPPKERFTARAGAAESNGAYHNHFFPHTRSCLGGIGNLACAPSFDFLNSAHGNELCESATRVEVCGAFEPAVSASKNRSCPTSAHTYSCAFNPRMLTSDGSRKNEAFPKFARRRRNHSTAAGAKSPRHGSRTQKLAPCLITKNAATSTLPNSR